MDAAKGWARPLRMTVAEEAVARAVEGALPGKRWFAGEIIDVHPGQFWSLELAGTEEPARPARMRAFIGTREAKVIEDFLRSRQTSLEQVLRVGQEVTLEATLIYWESGRTPELQVSRILPGTTDGDLRRRRDALRAQLRREGVLAPPVRVDRPLPPPLHGVALISADNSAGAGDMRRTLADAGLGWTWSGRLLPATLEGPRAPQSIVEALRAADRLGVDIILLGRGGGDPLALAVFDDEQVVRAVAACQTPVVTGIGHDRDHTLTDEAAYASCATPTAAAARVVGAMVAARASVHAADQDFESAEHLARLRLEQRHSMVLGATWAAASVLALIALAVSIRSPLGWCLAAIVFLGAAGALVGIHRWYRPGPDVRPSGDPSLNFPDTVSSIRTRTKDTRNARSPRELDALRASAQAATSHALALLDPHRERSRGRPPRR